MKTKETKAEDLLEIISDIFYYFDIQTLIDFLTSKIENSISTDDDGILIYTNAQIQEELAISSTLIRQLLKAHLFIEEYKVQNSHKES